MESSNEFGGELAPRLRSFSYGAAVLDRSVLNIGIQVRVGDRSFQGNDSVSWDIVEPYFHCAAQIEMTRARAGKRTVF